MPKFEDQSHGVIVPSARPVEVAPRKAIGGEPAPTPAWLNDLRKRERRPSGEVPTLTDQFLATLRTFAAEVEQRIGNQPSKPLERVRLLLGPENSDKSWLDAYEVEQQLVHLMAPEVLQVELAARLSEAGKVLSPAKVLAYNDMAKQTLDEAHQRSLLGRLVNDLQWTYTINEAKREFWRLISRRTASFFACAAGLFVISAGLALNRAGIDSAGKAWWEFTAEPLAPIGWPSALLALSAGAWGATFSMLTGLKGMSLEKLSLDQLKVMRFYSILLARVSIGAGGALIFLFFLASGLLSGQIFPAFGGTESVANPQSVATQCALLVVWCFVAGFSEKLVTGLLMQTENRGLGAGGERQPGEVVRMPGMTKKTPDDGSET